MYFTYLAGLSFAAYLVNLVSSVVFMVFTNGTVLAFNNANSGL